ncbi:MAG TPA: hypothetical protein V6D16_13090 [Candidatus Obscuribacterales bacterium]
MKANAVRVLDNFGITYELRSYEVDLEDLAAEGVAQKVGLPTEQVFKTLVARGESTGVCLGQLLLVRDFFSTNVLYNIFTEEFNPLCEKTRRSLIYR